jgi:hypothetical protein
MNLKGSGRKVWPKLRQYHGLHGRTEENRKRNLSHESQSSGRHFNLAYPEYEAFR